jgi:hypothetical protein
MSNAASNYTENLALKWLLTTDSATRPSAWYVALFTSDPTDAGSGTEVSGTNYARTAVTFTVTDDTATNSGAVTFNAAGSNWGTVSHIGVYNASTSGNLLFHGAVTTAKAIDSGDTFTISTSNLSITLA